MRRPILVVRNVLIDKQDRLLLGLRADVNLWELPGGKVDDEYVLDAALREQKEETGMTLQGIPRLVGYADGPGMRDPKKKFTDLLLMWPAWDGEPQLTEPDKQRAWLPLTPSAKIFAESILPTLCPVCTTEETC